MSPATFRLITWNINARARVPKLLDAIASLRPDVLALQEVRPNITAELQAGLAALGLGAILENATLARQNEFDRGLLVASRWPLQAGAAIATPYPHSVLSTIVASPWGPIELYNAHVPNAESHGWTKIETCEAISTHLARLPSQPRLLCGDLNSPRAELPDGQLVTWAYDATGDEFVRWETWVDSDMREGTGERWDAAERSVMTGLASFGLPDTFRMLNGYNVQAASWYTRDGTPRRYDHIFAARTLNPVHCAYLPFMEELSDHAPLEAVFAPTVRPAL